jgi:nucleotide-binding universal stress UspA family protein
LFGHCSGALHVARWLREASGGREEILGAHVPDPRLRTDGAELDEQLALAIDEALVRTLSGSLSVPIVGRRLVLARSPDEGLARATDELECEGILIGRAALPSQRPAPPLGSTARRLLRHLPASVMIVPSDLRSIGRGPVLLATDLGPSSACAGALARRLADSVGRPLHVTTVDIVGRKLEMLTEWLTISPRREPVDVEAWARRHELGTIDCSVQSGDMHEALLAASRALDAPVLVCGSRCLSVTDRIYTSSAANDLARHGDLPVLAVGE